MTHAPRQVATHKVTLRLASRVGGCIDSLDPYSARGLLPHHMKGRPNGIRANRQITSFGLFNKILPGF